MKLMRTLLAAVLLCLVAVPAYAGAGPQKTLEVVVNVVLDTLKNPGYADPATRPPLREKIEKAVEDVFDFSEFSARTVGSRWKSFTADQQRRFDEAFARLLMTTYLDNISGYNGEQVAYTGENISAKGNRAEVTTIVTLGDGKKVPVNYRMMEKQGRWVVYDVIIENVSLIKNYRSQFKEILVKDTPDQLIERVRETAASLNNKK